jgi:hypothetical protein
MKIPENPKHQSLLSAKIVHPISSQWSLYWWAGSSHHSLMHVAKASCFNVQPRATRAFKYSEFCEAVLHLHWEQQRHLSPWIRLVDIDQL